jgi:hypothetical protein
MIFLAEGGEFGFGDDSRVDEELEPVGCLVQLL